MSGSTEADPPVMAARSQDDMEDAMKFLTRDEARRFAERWPPAWTGSDPERLAGFYSGGRSTSARERHSPFLPKGKHSSPDHTACCIPSRARLRLGRRPKR